MPACLYLPSLKMWRLLISCPAIEHLPVFVCSHAESLTASSVNEEEWVTNVQLIFFYHYFWPSLQVCKVEKRYLFFPCWNCQISFFFKSLTVPQHFWPKYAIVIFFISSILSQVRFLDYFTVQNYSQKEVGIWAKLHKKLQLDVSWVY